jgi:hypothetical protein
MANYSWTVRAYLKDLGDTATTMICVGGWHTGNGLSVIQGSIWKQEAASANRPRQRHPADYMQVSQACASQHPEYQCENRADASDDRPDCG